MILGRKPKAKFGHRNEALPLDTENDQHLFRLMQKAYGDARYKDGYIISRSHVEVLISKVQSLQKIAVEITAAKF